MQALHFFEYGEELNLRGAPELAAAFYRQAYALLKASLEATPQSSGPFLAASTTSPEPSQGFPLASPVAVDPEKTLARLGRDLDVQTASATVKELTSLREQGFASAELHRLEGSAFLLLKDMEKAEDCFRDALSIDPDHYVSLVNLAGILLTKQDADEATGLLQRALQLVSNESSEAYPALGNLALAHEQLGRSMEAAEVILRMHRIRPGQLPSYRLLQAARTLEEMGEDPKAIELLSWLKDHAHDEEVLRRLAELLERRGDYQEAALVYRELLGKATSMGSA